MALLPFRSDSRLFGFVFVVFNVLLAVFNILNYRVASRATVPCVVIVAPTSESHVRTETATEVVVTHPSQRRTTTLRQKQLNTGQNTTITTTNATSSSITPSTRWLPPKRNSSGNATDVGGMHNSSWDTEKRDKYLVVKNYIPAEGEAPGFNNSVTLSTQGTFEFLQHAQSLCRRWQGPVSVSVYAPGTDLPVALRKILFLRQCGHPCVRLNVSWHLIYDSLLGPPPDQLGSPNETSELEGPLNCSAGMGALDLVSEIRMSKKMPYPINVARNVARQLARTRYVLASDIELYPSLNIIPRFMNLVSREAPNQTQVRHVYTLPIFEIKKEFPPPETKSELVQRVASGQAIFFHKWVCDACQNFPRRNEWLKYLPANDTLAVFEVTKRQQPRTAWEPIYIGTNAEPLYDERLTWEGKRDKMSQMYELCLMDYDFRILDNAFLVHSPGIKTLSSLDQKRRAPYMYKNNAVHNKLLAEMRKKYGARKGC